MRQVTDLLRSVRLWLNQPVGDLNRAQRTVRFAVDLTRHCARQLQRDKAPQMAAALTYRTIFSLIPLAVLMLLVFRAFSDLEQVRSDWQDRLFNYMGLSTLTITSQAYDVLLEENRDPDDPTDGTDHDTAVTDPTDRSGSSTPGTSQDSPPPPSPPDDADQTSTNNALGDALDHPPGDAPDNDPSHNLGDSPGNSPAPTAENAEAQRMLRASIDKIVGDLTEKAANVSFGSIGMVGLAVLIWAGLSLVITVEQAFNQIYQCPDGRPWHMRILLYWSVVTLGPVLLFVSFNVAGTLIDWLGGLDSWGLFSRSLRVLSGFVAVGATWLLIFLLYVLMPNTHVRLRAALIGAFVAAVLWESSKWGFKLYVTKAVSYSALYGSLGLLPLFLLWLYLTWLIILFGLEITSTLQTMRGNRLQKEQASSDPRQQVNPYWIIPLMTEVAGEFSHGRVITAEGLAQRLGVSIRTAGVLTGLLEEVGLLSRVVGEGDQAGGYALAMPPQNIDLTRLLDIGQSLVKNDANPSDGRVYPFMRRLLDAQKDVVSQATLADLIESGQRIVS